MEQLLKKLNALPPDKVAHFAVGVIAFAAFVWISVSLACAVVILAAVGKEIYDKMHPDTHTPDIWDAVVTMAGGAVGLFIRLI